MTRKKPRTKEVVTREIIEEDEDERELPGPLEDPEEESLNYALRQFDDRTGLELRYYLVQPGGSVFIGGPYSDAIPEAQLQEWYPAGGKFEVRIYVNGNFRDRRYVAIGPKPGPVGAAGGSSELHLLKEMFSEMRQELRTLRQNPQSSNIVELVTALKGLSDISRPAGGDSMLEYLKLGVELGKNGGGGGDDDLSVKGILGGIAKDVAPGLLQAWMTSKAQPNGNHPPMIEAGATVVDNLLKQGIGFLKKKALVGSDPGLYIATILDNADDERSQHILRAVANQEFDAFAAIDPEIAQPPYAEFFKSFYDGLRSALAEQNSVAEPPGGAGRDVAHAPGNGATRAKRGSK